jgi:tetratricopeptide (TPR) repeat protein
MSQTGAAAAATNDPIQAALALRAQGRLREALNVLSLPGDFGADVYTLRGDLQAELGQIKEAAGSYFTALASEPGNIYARSHLGRCLYRLRRWDAACEAFEAVLKAEPHRDDIRVMLGDCLLRLGRHEDALLCFDQCWSDHSRRQALFGKAVALQLLRRFDEAEAHYERLLLLDPKAEEALSNMIAMCLEMFDLEKVSRYARHLFALNVRSAPALKGLAVVALERQEYERAARYILQLRDAESHTLERDAAAAGSSRAPNEGAAQIEYRLSSELIDLLADTQFVQAQAGPSRARVRASSGTTPNNPDASRITNGTLTHSH